MKKSIREYIKDISQEYYEDSIVNTMGSHHHIYGDNSQSMQGINNYLASSAFKTKLLNKISDLTFDISQNTYNVHQLGLNYYNNLKISRIRSVGHVGMMLSDGNLEYKDDLSTIGDFAYIKLDVKNEDGSTLYSNTTFYWDTIMLGSLLSENEYNVALIQSKIKTLEDFKLEKQKELHLINSQIQSFEWISSFMIDNKIEVMDQTVLKTKMALSMFDIEDDAEKEANIYELFQLNV
mgnify:CR=1 FL=1|tara:strand:+ start:5283 stop:5990 length:708 start_codon:yes stop_codon:yes gene_type:complete